MRKILLGVVAIAVSTGFMFLAGCPPCEEEEECDSLSGDFYSVVYRIHPWFQPGGSAALGLTETFNDDGTGTLDFVKPDGTVIEDAPFTYEVDECGEFTSERGPGPGQIIQLTGLFNPETEYQARIDHSTSLVDAGVTIGFGIELPKTTPELLGNFVAVDIHSDPQNMELEAERHEMAFNDDGTGLIHGATPAEDTDFTFTVAADGKLDIVEDDWDVSLMDGLVSQDGNTFVGLDRNGGDDSRIGIQIGFRRAGGVTAAMLAGEYHLVALHDTSVEGPRVMRGSLVLNADGTGTVAEVAPDGLGMPAPRAVTYVFDAADEITLSFTDDGEVAEGIVSWDAGAIILADFAAVDNTDTIGLTFCVRKP